MNALVDFLNSAREATRINWQGVRQRINWPIGQMVARCGEVFLIQTGIHTFAVVYGLEVTRGLSREAAASSFGHACIHQAECHSLLIEDSP